MQKYSASNEINVIWKSRKALQSQKDISYFLNIKQNDDHLIITDTIQIDRNYIILEIIVK